MIILEHTELVSGKHYWLYPKNCIVLDEDSRRVCRTTSRRPFGETFSLIVLRFEDSDQLVRAVDCDDCLFIEIPNIDQSVWEEHAKRIGTYRASTND